MTHILVNPGYSLKHVRARTVDDDLTGQKYNQRKLTEIEMKNIRSESRLTWLAAWEDPGKPAVKSVHDWHSTYSRQHDFKQLDRPTKSRPTSPTRRNNPHPPGVFLRLRVSKEKGYPSVHPKPPQNPYEEKYVYDSAPVPDGTMYYSLKDIQRLKRDGHTEVLRKALRPNEESNFNSFGVPEHGRDFSPSSSRRNSNHIAKMTPDHPSKPAFVPSLHRWLKCAGVEEREKMNNARRNAWLQDSKFKTVDPNRYLLRTYDSTPQVKIHRPYRKEFGIHPELWTN
ncbi:uncharacterized protein LOC114531961 [Dendronephthya gigantea]|uniref:uncharacterized protein LOC114531961 n=1 Tax=Dendronephthya gigantea TaxID=151771 RepID=UPI00106A4FA7|nr:uncharacterized protein LOC114531961 [Dendronephthya gigantea]